MKLKKPSYGRESISRPMPIVAPIPQQGGPRIPKNPNCLKNRKKSQKTQKLKNVQKYAKISDTPFDQRSLIHLEAWFPPYFVRQNQPKKTIFFVWRLYTTSKLKCSNLRPLIFITFPQGFRISKKIGHLTSGSGGKRRLNGTLKVKTRTDRLTRRQTFSLIESISPEG